MILTRHLETTIESNALRMLSTYARAFTVIVFVAVAMLWVNESTRTGPQHELFTSAILADLLVSAAVMVYLSFQVSVVQVLAAVYTTLWYTSRAVVTYFVPERLENIQFQFFTAAEVAPAARYLMWFSVAMAVVSLVHGIMYPARRVRPLTTPPPPPEISFLGVKVDLMLFLRAAMVFALLATAYRVLVLATGVGIRVSVTYQAEEYLQRVAQSLSFPFYLLAFFALCTMRDRIGRIMGFAMIALIIADGLVSTSRGWSYAMVVRYVLCALTLHMVIPRRTRLLFVGLMLAGLLIVYPAMTALRPLVATGEQFTADDYTTTLDRVAPTMAAGTLAGLDRFAGFDWLILWATMPVDAIPPNASMYGEVVDFVNRFVPGELVTIPGSEQLNKLQAVLAGVATEESLEELGGRGDVMGGVATFLIFLGPLGGILATGFWFFATLRLERSRVHPLHKAYLYQVYVQDMIIGGGYLLMPVSFFWYLIVSTIIAGGVWVFARRQARTVVVRRPLAAASAPVGNQAPLTRA